MNLSLDEARKIIKNKITFYKQVENKGLGQIIDSYYYESIDDFCKLLEENYVSTDQRDKDINTELLNSKSIVISAVVDGVDYKIYKKVNIKYTDLTLYSRRKELPTQQIIDKLAKKLSKYQIITETLMTPDSLHCWYTRKDDKHNIKYENYEDLYKDNTIDDIKQKKEDLIEEMKNISKKLKKLSPLFNSSEFDLKLYEKD